MSRDGTPLDHEIRLARARKQDRENNAHLSEISNLFEVAFRPVSPLDAIFINGSSGGIGVTIFYRNDADIAEQEANGTSQRMKDFICDKLEAFGRGRCSDISVIFDFDSFENVKKKFGGDYFLRMR